MASLREKNVNEKDVRLYVEKDAAGVYLFYEMFKIKIVSSRRKRRGKDLLQFQGGAILTRRQFL